MMLTHRSGVATGLYALALLVAVVPSTAPGAAAGTAGNPPGISVTVPAHGAVAAAIRYAQDQVGKPYLWGGTGPGAYDCSGLVMMAYRAAGITIPRTSETQWDAGVKVPASQVQPGDLVYFAGSDGTTAAPGHVGLVVGDDTMIEAYATGFPIRVSTFGRPSSAPGDNTVAGFTRPTAGGA